MTPTLRDIDQRLQDRYELLVQEHAGQAHPTAAGPRCLPTPAQAQAQAAWRFFHNRRLTLPTLMQPLLELARQETPTACDQYALIVHDWSPLNYSSHTAKKDRLSFGHCQGRGYELYAALLVSDQQGRPIAPLRVRLRSRTGVCDSASAPRRLPRVHLDSLSPILHDLHALGLPRPLVHIIDAEGDSVYHLRQWQAAGYFFLVRTDDQRVVRYRDADWKLPDVVKRLRKEKAFTKTRAVSFHGQSATQYVAEAPIVLARPAWLHRTQKDGRRQRQVVPGDPLPVRLIVSEVRAADGTVLARWQLRTNLPAPVDAATVALWYYWRWQIESYFKLLKSAGQQLEQWQQEDAEAVARRLVVASMACGLVWRLARSTAPQAAAARTLLQQLSGRQVAWGQAFTEEALLAGFWVLLAMVAVLKERTPAEVQQIADFILAGSG